MNKLLDWVSQSQAQKTSDRYSFVLVFFLLPDFFPSSLTVIDMYCVMWMYQFVSLNFIFNPSFLFQIWALKFIDLEYAHWWWLIVDYIESYKFLGTLRVKRSIYSQRLFNTYPSFSVYFSSLRDFLFLIFFCLSAFVLFDFQLMNIWYFLRFTK